MKSLTTFIFGCMISIVMAVLIGWGIMQVAEPRWSALLEALK